MMAPKSCFFACAAVAAALHSAAGVAADRFVFAAKSCLTERGADEAAALVRRAAAEGCCAIALDSAFDRIGSWSDGEMANFRRFESVCRECGVEIVPLVWSVGYGTMLWQDPDLAEGLPLDGVEYAAEGGRLVPQPGKTVVTLADFRVVDGATVERTPGGGASFRDFGEDGAFHARMAHRATLKPHRRYVVSGRVRSVGMGGGKSAFLVQGYDDVGTPEEVHYFANAPLEWKPDGEWVDFSFHMTTGDEAGIEFWVGVWAWSGLGGRAELASLEVREATGVGAILRRDGCPVRVRSAEGGRAFAEGADYEVARGADGAASFRAVPGGAIADGEKVLVDAYATFPLKNGTQIPVCMSERKLYRLFAANARDIEAAFSPKRWFLSMDEIRLGGTCKACRDRSEDMAHILASCVRTQRGIIRRVHPGAEVIVWGDMFNPWANAVKRYSMTRGSFEGSLALIPKDVVIADWNGETWDRALGFYEKNGFSVLCCTYYDTATLEEKAYKEIDLAAGRGNVRGFMYTTWMDKYGFLADFWRRVDERRVK